MQAATPLLRRRALIVLGAGGALAAPLSPAVARALAHARTELFGGPVELLLPDRAAARHERAVMHGLRELNTRWNAWKPGELTALNAALREGRAFQPRPDLAALLRWSARLEAQSLGTFNPAIGALVQAWGFHTDRLDRRPAPAAGTLAALAGAAPSLRHLEWRGGAVRARASGLQIDLGAIGKGWALDAALDGLQALGVEDALLNLGGNLAVMGAPAGRRWRVGVRDPQGAGVVAWLETRGREAVVTSGIYERERRAGDVRASHVIDPRAGRPARQLASVTVVDPSATFADAAATALLVAGPEGWPAVARRLGAGGVLVIDTAGRRTATPALAARLHDAA